MAHGETEAMAHSAERDLHKTQSITSDAGERPRVAAVVPMAGRGTRVGSPTAKQFWRLQGKPLYIHTLLALRQHAPLRQIALAVPPDMADAVRADVEAAGFRVDTAGDDTASVAATDGGCNVRVVAGGDSRHLSIQAGLRALDPCDVVIVHDAVRPFVYPEILAALVDACAGSTSSAPADRVGAAALAGAATASEEPGKAPQAEAAGAVRPLVDTVVRGENGWLVETVRRDAYRASQTPQAFRLATILRAYEAAERDDPDELIRGTECLELVRRHAGARVRLIEGGPELWKITYKHDLYTAKEMLREGQRKVALVTGGSRGIGRAVARALRDRGMTVAVAARERETLERVARELGAIPIVADVSRPADARTLVERVVSDCGRLDVLVNNAGVASVRDIADTDDDLWQRVVDTNLSGAFYCAREAIRQMAPQGGGVIIQIGSSAVRGGRVGQGAYAATKAGLVSLTETIALEGREQGIQAFTVIPERTATELRRELYPDEDHARMLQPETVAEMVAFCATEWLGPLSGQSFWVRRG